MTTTFYLIFNSRGNVVVKIGKRKAPRIENNQIALKLRLEVPNRLFERPMFEANVVVRDEGEQSRFNSTEITTQIQNAIANQAGINVRLITVNEE